jgi:hypothetical protein
MRSSTETGHDAAETSVDASLDFTLKPEAESTTLYFVGYGKAATVLNSCVGGPARGNEFIGLEQLTADEVRTEKVFRADHRNDAGWGNSAGAVFYKMHTSGSPGVDRATGYDTATPCQLDNMHFWAKRGSRYVFSAPLIEVDIVRDPAVVPDEVLPGVSEPGGGPADFCARVALGWRVGISPGDPNPAPTHTYSLSDPAGGFLDNGFEWANCQTIDDEYEDNGFGVIQPAPTVHLNDDLSADVATRDVFIAAVLLGLIGGIVIEIIGGAFDVAEWFTRVLRRRAESDNESDAAEDEEMDASPDSPYNPGSRGYL